MLSSFTPSITYSRCFFYCMSSFKVSICFWPPRSKLWATFRKIAPNSYFMSFCGAIYLRMNLTFYWKQLISKRMETNTRIRLTPKDPSILTLQKVLKKWGWPMAYLLLGLCALSYKFGKKAAEREREIIKRTQIEASYRL